jgi:ATP-dependent RNA helicase DeaD
VFLNDPLFVSLSEGQVAPQQIEHFYMVTTAQEKEANLARIIEDEDPESAIIFCNTKDDVRFVTAYLQRRGFDADQISGDLAQAAREKAMKRIKGGKLKFLIATDVAARGIDISDLSHVISYSASDSPEVYTHRTGRTGRAGKSGVAISFVSGLDIGNFKYMQTVNKTKIAERKIPTEKQLVERTRERLQVKVEQEMRAVPAQQIAFKVEKLIPVVEAMAKDHEGRRDLAAICAAYLAEHQPQTTVDNTGDESPDAEDGTSSASDPAAQEAPQRRRSGGRDGGGQRGRGRRR